MTALSVPDRAAAIATFRFIEVKLMELVATWTPSTPEMEAKVMFGRHIWDAPSSCGCPSSIRARRPSVTWHFFSRHSP